MKIEYRNIKYPRLEFRSGELELITPHGQNPENLSKKYAGWINKKKEFIDRALQSSRKLALSKKNLVKLKVLVNHHTIEYSKETGVSVTRITFKDMKSKWGSCSKYGNLTFNSKLKYLPNKLIKYIVFHEVTHLIFKKHDKLFWNQINSKFPDHQKLELKLFAYWFKIQKENG